MSYDALRHFADSWGLLMMTLMFVSFIGWTFRKGASADHERASRMIFKDDENV
jgi:cytochrome c oxidase cbb3-type subunit IV